MSKIQFRFNLPFTPRIPLQLIWRTIIFFSQGGVISFWVLYIFLLFIALIFPFAELGGEGVDAFIAQAVVVIFSVVFFQVDVIKHLISPAADFSMHADHSSLAQGIGTWFFIGGVVSMLYSRIRNALRKNRGLPALPEKEPTSYFSFLKRASIPYAIGIVIATVFGGWITALAFLFFSSFLFSLSLSYPVRTFAKKRLRAIEETSESPGLPPTVDTPPTYSLPS